MSVAGIAPAASTPGAWLHGRLFPRRSDLSPDGRLLCYFAQKPAAAWEHGDTYVAISRLPWLAALHAFGTCGTWARGYYFTEDGSWDDPVHGALPMAYGLRSIPVVQFANERRRGWEEAPDAPQRRPEDVWDQHRNARLEKPRPNGGCRLRVESLGWAGGEFGVEQAVDGLRVRYWLDCGEGFMPLDEAQWADWDQEGRLLVATRSGKLQVRELRPGRFRILSEHDLSGLLPNPAPAPDWAGAW